MESSVSDSYERGLAIVACLNDPIRRRLYEAVAGSQQPLGRDQAAAQVGVSRQVAAYHLDRLAEDGLVEVEFRRLSGRSGPGAGRPSKLYRRSQADHQVSVPPRRYALAARILLDAVRDGEVDRGAIEAAAHRTGEELGEAGLAAALVANGYEPVDEAGEIRFRNCPFHLLRERDRQTVCELNLALVEGIIEGSGVEAEAVLAPEDGYCCVRLRTEPGVRS
jgi:predicted ArsR family transcriptional regulator